MSPALQTVSRYGILGSWKLQPPSPGKPFGVGESLAIRSYFSGPYRECFERCEALSALRKAFCGPLYS
ncbi:hypothetical protein OAM00_05855, partial [Verrucomicrobia bacterium]|nr:hypothetical protein [Verrucomicrobiota bacterium]